MFEKLNNNDIRRIAFCFFISIVSLFIAQTYFTKVFPDASIKMDVTKEEAHIIAKNFLANNGHDIESYIHADRFGHERDAKNFLEFELPADSAGQILNNTNSYYWRNRWFVPQQNEQFYVKISTTGNLSEYDHTIDEEAPGDSLIQENALNIARFFLVGTIGIELDKWELVESNTEKLKNRWDHRLEWKEKEFNINESTHRITIKVQGDQVDYFKEWIKVPDTWKRKYEKIRSKNELLSQLGGMGISITLFLIFIMIFVRSRKQDIRWKTAWVYGGIAALIMLLMQVNNLPIQLYGFDNKDSYSAFVIQVILIQCVLVPIVIGVIIGGMVAGSEPLYRDQYPHHISFRHVLSNQGIKSKSFFNSAIIGISLTFATFAFQTIFYLIANNMGGWSPGNIPNLDQYATYIPWVGVLLVGFFPAIQEESISRMFSIPFLQKYTKSTILAVLVSSILWGIAHSNYPAQPFYIRALEVSAMGIFVSWIFIKYGILTTLIWHFSTNAFYSAMILLRSSNAYFITTGAVCAGIVIFPLIYAIISYIRNGGFANSDNLVNALDTEIVEGKSDTKEIIQSMKKQSTSYKSLSSGRIKLGIGIGVIGVLLLFINTKLKSNDPIYTFSRLDKNRTEAIEIAKEYLLSREFKLDGYQSVAYSSNFLSSEGLLNRQDKQVAYIIEHEGKDKLRDALSSDELGGMGWTVRFFRPETKREYKVWLLAKYDEALWPHFRETLSDTAYLPSVTQANALDLVYDFAKNTDIDLSNMDLTKKEKLDKENRTDYTFKFEGNENHPFTIGGAKRAFEFSVHGSHIGSINGSMKIPEAWEREYREKTIYDNIHMFSFFFVFISLGIIGIRYLLQLIKDNNPNWKFLLYFASFLSILAIIAEFNTATWMWNYKTSEPLSIYMTQKYMGAFFEAIVAPFFIGILILAVHMAWPNFFNSFKKKNRKMYLKDGLVSFFCTIGVFTMYGTLNTWLTTSHSTFISRNNFSFPTINDYFPFIDLLSKYFMSTLIFMLVIVGAIYIYDRIRTEKYISKFVLLSLIGLPFILPAHPSLIHFVVNILWYGSLLFLVRYFWRWNPISFMLGVFCLEVLPSIMSHLSVVQDPSYRNHIIAIIFCTTIFLLYLLKETISSFKKSN